MCEVRLRIGLALPRALGLEALERGAFAHDRFLHHELSGRRLLLFSAFAIALFSVCKTIRAAFFGVKARISSAAATGKPWISRVTSRHLKAEMRAPR